MLCFKTKFVVSTKSMNILLMGKTMQKLQMMKSVKMLLTSLSTKSKFFVTSSSP